MTLRAKLYICLGVALLIAIATTTSWQSHKITALENSVNDAKRIAAQKQEAAQAKELEAAEYKQKTEYLEQQLSQIKANARKQDEHLQNTITNTRSASGDVERARRRRTIPANTVELCAKLAELGHACEGS